MKNSIIKIFGNRHTQRPRVTRIGLKVIICFHTIRNFAKQFCRSNKKFFSTDNSFISPQQRHNILRLKQKRCANINKNNFLLVFYYVLNYIKQIESTDDDQTSTF